MAHPFIDPLLRRFGLSVSPTEMPILICAFEKRFAPEYFVQQIEAAQAGELQPTGSPIVITEEAEE